MKVSDVMTRDVITVPRSASLKEAASVLVQRGISGVPVVDDGKVVGVFSERDLLFKEQGKPDGTHWLTWLTDPLAVADRPKLEAHTRRRGDDHAGRHRRGRGERLGRRAPDARGRRQPAARARDGIAGRDRDARRSRAGVRPERRGDRSRDHDEILARTLWIKERCARARRSATARCRSAASCATRSTADLLRRLVAQVPGVVSVETDLQLV